MVFFFLIKIDKSRKSFYIINTSKYWDSRKDSDFLFLQESLRIFSTDFDIDIHDISSSINFQEYDRELKTDGYCALWSLYFIWKYNPK